VYDEDALVGLSTKDNKCLCAGVTICVPIVARKFDWYILTPVTRENRSSHGWTCQLVH